MPKTNRKPGIHLHMTEPKQAIKRHANGVTYGPPVQPEYYWILIAKNGKTIAKSSETYKRKRDAVKSIVIAEEIFDSKGYFYDHTTGGVEVEEVVIN